MGARVRDRLTVAAGHPQPFNRACSVHLASALPFEFFDVSQHQNPLRRGHFRGYATLSPPQTHERSGLGVALKVCPGRRCGPQGKGERPFRGLKSGFLARLDLDPRAVRRMTRSCRLLSQGQAHEPRKSSGGDLRAKLVRYCALDLRIEIPRLGPRDGWLPNVWPWLTPNEPCAEVDSSPEAGRHDGERYDESTISLRRRRCGKPSCP